MIRIKRVYDPPELEDGLRFLVDRLWPRGMKKEALRMDGWLQEVAPSSDLRHWYGHDPARWEEFCRRYNAELEANKTAWQPLLNLARKQDVTLLCSAHDTMHSNAMALKLYFEARHNDSH